MNDGTNRMHSRPTVFSLAFGEWPQVFSYKKMTTALLDRVTHH